MIKRLLVIIALLAVSGAATWMQWNPEVVLPITLFGAVGVVSPVSIMLIAVVLLMMTLIIGIFVYPC